MLHQRVAPEASQGFNGLTSLEVSRRRDAGDGNITDERTSRSLGSILRANVLTRFNAIIASLAAVVLVFGSPVDALFGFVMVFNSVIGIVQELRARRSLDALRVLLVPSIGAVRDGVLSRVEPSELVLGDVIEVKAGDQIPVDGVVLVTSGLEVDESALTGESEPVLKPTGSEILSGSVAVAGSAMAEATAVGEHSWASQLTREAKDFVLTDSELRVGLERLLRVISYILPPLAALLVWSQLRSTSSLADGLVWAVAGVVALVPQGLVLLISMALAVAVVRLSAENVVVQELPAVEGLARVNVLCLDKTGTLTTGRFVVEEVKPIGVAEDDLRSGLAGLAKLEAAGSSTMDAIGEQIRTPGPDWAALAVVPFSSVRKWSAATFEGHGTWVLGAPEVLLDAMRGHSNDVRSGEVHSGEVDSSDSVSGDVAGMVADRANRARRVLLVAHTPDSIDPAATVDATNNSFRLPSGLHPVGLISLKEELRPDASETLGFFKRQNVSIKVISGDNPATVAAVAAELDMPGARHHVDMREISDLDSIPTETSVFGRVLPEQKRDLVRLLQSRGDTVAMTGDGVNDIPSLKAADIGIAMNTATPATKAVAQLVLMDGRFDRLPVVVAEGRRVIANMERVSSLFVTKTVYATLLALAVGVAGIAFPFLPRHLSLIAAITIGVPAFVLSFRSSNEPCRPGYLRRVLHFAVPAGLVAATGTFATYWIARSPVGDATLEQARTAATMALTLIGLWVLYRLIRPLDRVGFVLLAAMASGFVITLVPSPIAEFYALELPPFRTTTVMLVVLTGSIATIQLLMALTSKRRQHAGAKNGPV